MTILLLSSLAFASGSSDDATPMSVATPIQRTTQANRKTQSQGGKQQNKGAWKKRFYARPALSGSTFTTADGSTTTALGVGGEGGLRYWEVRKPFPRLRGRTRR